MTIRILLLVSAALLAGPAVAQELARPPDFNLQDYPPEVQQAIRYGKEECRRQDGGEVTFAADTVRKLDLTGDGRDDYIVSFEDTKCAGFEPAYCGTGGCSMDILVTLPNGRIRTVFSGRVRAYEILPARAAQGGGRTIRFQLHGGYCGRSGNPSCMKQHRITAKPFEFKQPD